MNMASVFEIYLHVRVIVGYERTITRQHDINVTRYYWHERAMKMAE